MNKIKTYTRISIYPLIILMFVFTLSPYVSANERDVQDDSSQWKYESPSESFYNNNLRRDFSPSGLGDEDEDDLNPGGGADDRDGNYNDASISGGEWILLLLAAMYALKASGYLNTLRTSLKTLITKS